jgi:hypothetical protein
MSRRSLVFGLVLLLACFILVGCPGGGTSGGGTSGGGATTDCPPYSSAHSALVPAAGDVSSISIPSGASGKIDGDGDWCNPDDVGITTVDFNALVSSHGCFVDRNDTTPPCSPLKGLGAVDVTPSNTYFSGSPKPTLRYDLTTNPPQQDNSSYMIYQLKATIPPAPTRAWRYVGPAYPSTFSGKSVAAGGISHFSVFALVEAPPAVPVPSPFAMVTIVASDFIDDDRGTISVELEVVEVIDGDVTARPGEPHVFLLTNVDPAYSDPGLPQECLDLGSTAEQLTCLFPEGILLEIRSGVDGTDNLISIFAPERAYEARLFANVQMH